MLTAALFYWLIGWAFAFYESKYVDIDLLDMFWISLKWPYILYKRMKEPWI